MQPRCCAPEQVIEADDAEHPTRAEVQALRHQVHRALIEMTSPCLHLLQHLDQSVGSGPFSGHQCHQLPVDGWGLP